MSHGRKTEQVTIIRVNRRGDILSYDTIEQPIEPVKSSSKHYSRPKKVKQPVVYKENSYYSEEDTSDVNVPVRKTYENTIKETKPERRRLSPLQSDREIVEERIIWQGKARTDSHNENTTDRRKSGRKSIRVAGDPNGYVLVDSPDNYSEEHTRSQERGRSLRNEKQNINSTRKRGPISDEVYSDIQNYEYDDRRIQYKPARLPPVQNRTFGLQQKSRSNSRNDDYTRRIRKSRSTSNNRKSSRYDYIKPKIDDRNEEYVRNIKYEPKPRNTSKLPRWRSEPKMGSFNVSYDTKPTYRQPRKFSGDPNGWRLVNNRNNYDEDDTRHQERRRSLRNEKQNIPIHHRTFGWQQKSQNNDSTGRIRKHRPTSVNARKNTQYNSIKPKIDNHNEEFVKSLKYQSKPRIINDLPLWKYESKTKSYNDSYNPELTHRKPKIFREKLDWNARSKIDSGFATNA
ncbi:unnamed protein product [Adineta steineri]|uniref:Uncharacterized protein n=1 Tax=Adineta steineri TaxID=433720 RepID=A0A816EY14_9BILA|nr:unnamed protein product [Adineta steineri]CAF1652052.1 unnamed protein product [Adineta steineri]